MYKSIHEEVVCVMINHALKRMSEVNKSNRCAIYGEYNEMFLGLEEKHTNFEVLYLKYLGNPPLEEEKLTFN